MRVAVVGLGKIGLPIAVQIASRGFPVLGADVSERVVAEVNRGRCPLPREAGLPEKLREAVSQGLLRATADITAAARESRVIVIIVPVLLSEERKADLRSMDAAVRAIAPGLREGSLVVIETTLPVGTTRNRVGPMLEEGSGLVAGRDFKLAFSPERVGSGRILHDLEAYPKLVGGVNAESTKAAAEFYSRVLDAPVMRLASAETAEFTKLAELVYRDVNIALANQLAQCADRAGVDIREVITAANSEPLSHIHQPGVGVGGHCVPVNPYFLIDGLGPISLASSAREINDSMAEYARELVEEELGGLGGRRVLILGLAYRPNVKEAAYSPTFRLRDALEAAGAEVMVNDPVFSPEEVEAAGFVYADLAPPPKADAVVLQVLHDEYRSLDWSAFAGCRALLDGRNALDPESIAARGMRYIGMGRTAAGKALGSGSEAETVATGG